MRSFVNNLMCLSLMAVLALGGQVSLCSVVAVFGVDVHHHEHPAESSGICFESESACHDEERAPCPEACQLELADLLLPDVIEQPSCPITDQDPEWISGVKHSLPRRAAHRLDSDPPPRVALSDRAFTGRFLV